MADTTAKIALFEQKKIRRVRVDDERFFSVVDVVEALTDSSNPTDYLKKLRKRDAELGMFIGTNCPQVEMKTITGKTRQTLAGNTEHLLRIIQSIPSPKAEPFKRWLAKVGYERWEEIQNPELAQERMKQLYEAKGYPQDWIDKRLRGIAIRQNLTDERKARGITEQSDYAILTAEISKATFGMTPSEYKAFKHIPKTSKANLRDNMTDLELIFTMLGEKMTTEISEQEQPKGMDNHKKVAKRGGKVAGNARKEAEKELGRSVMSNKNVLGYDNTTLTIETYDNITQEYVKYFQTKDLGGNVQFQREIDCILSFLGDGAKILDVGTAIGDYPKFLTEQCAKNFEVIGIDASEKMIAIAKGNAPKATFQVMDMRNLIFPQHSFDAILCFATLIHLNDEDCLKVLDSFTTLLKDTGILCINVMEYQNGEKETLEEEPCNPKYTTYFNRYTKQFFIKYFEQHKYTLLKLFDNRLFNPDEVGEIFKYTNQFSLIAKKSNNL